jgi:ligand-binding sensor domain-containing protein/signal transduction histidine kinase
MLDKRITGKLLITGMMILFLISCQTWSQQPEHESANQNDSVSAQINIKAGQPEVHQLADLPVPKKIAVSDFKAAPKYPADFFIPMKTFNTEEGLAMSSILCGFIDHNGFLWYGTSGNGVSRYDGQSFTNFTSSNGLIHNLINCITEDSRGNIWFGTYGGISVYDGRSFRNYTIDQGLPDNDINKILEDREGNIWIGTQKGLSLIRASENIQIKKNFINFDKKAGLLGDFVLDILQDKNGVLWIATEKGVFKRNPGEEVSFSDIFENAGLDTRIVQTIAEDQEGTLWFGTDNGVIMYDPSEKEKPQHLTTLNGLVNDDVRCSLVGSLGNVWFGTSGGVSGYNLLDGTFLNLTTEQGFSHNIVCSITEDETGSLWFGTLGGGLSRYDGQSITGFTPKQGLPGTVVYAVTEDQKGNLWFGTNDAGITEFTHPGKDTHTSSFINYSSSQGLPENYIVAILADQRSNLWLGSLNGLYRFDGASFYIYTTNQGLVNNYVVSLENDRQGNLWIGTYEGGVSRFDGASFTNFTTRQGLIHNTVWDIMEDKAGNFWFATRGGLSIYNGTNFINFKSDQGLPDNKLSSVLEDREGNILIGTWGGGISVIRKNNAERLTGPKYPEISEPIFENYSTNDGLSNNVVYNILEDSSGNIFIGTNEGITVLKDGLDPSGKNLARSGIENFNQKAGYPIKDISNNNSMFLDSRGIIWAGTGDKLVRFDYRSVNRNNVAPKVFIRDVKINNEKISWYSLQKDQSQGGKINTNVAPYQNYEQLVYGKILSKSERDTILTRFSSIRFDSVAPFFDVPLNLVLPYAHNSIAFDFVGVETRRSFLVQYQYKLEGYDENWSLPNTASSAAYGNLPPGDYTLLVKAQSPEGIWSEPAAYPFEILPPWYRTWPAYLYYGLLLILGIYLIDRLQRRRLIAKERQRTMQRELEQAKEIEKSYLELKVAQAQLVQSEKMATLGELAAGIAHEIQNPLNFVNNFSEVSAELAKEMDEEIDKGNTDEVKAIIADLIQNLGIISQHGKRASSIVKGMLEHSRTSKGEKRPIDINALADEFLRLSYHGLRVKDKSFNANFKMIADENLPKVYVLPQDIGRVLLNLINNAFYACSEREKQYKKDYEPMVEVITKKGDGNVEIRIKDNGTGIPQDVLDKIFQPFFTTKTSGQGTGLGLSLSYDIIKAHGGELKVETEPGKGTTFIIYLKSD